MCLLLRPYFSLENILPKRFETVLDTGDETPLRPGGREPRDSELTDESRPTTPVSDPPGIGEGKGTAHAGCGRALSPLKVRTDGRPGDSVRDRSTLPVVDSSPSRGRRSLRRPSPHPSFRPGSHPSTPSTSSDLSELHSRPGWGLRSVR